MVGVALALRVTRTGIDVKFDRDWFFEGVGKEGLWREVLDFLVEFWGWVKGVWGWVVFWSHAVNGSMGVGNGSVFAFFDILVWGKFAWVGVALLNGDEVSVSNVMFGVVWSGVGFAKGSLNNDGACDDS